MPIKPREKGIITLAFDDAYLDTYKYAIRYLTKHNIKSTIAVSPALIGKKFENRQVMKLRHIKNAIKFGHEIASHTLSHANLLKLAAEDKKSAILELSESKKVLEKLLNCKINSFVFPYIKNNRTRFLYLKAKEYYKSAGITAYNPYFNSIPPRDPYDIVGFAVMKKHSLSYLNTLVDHAEKHKLWLTEVFHLVSKKNTLSAHMPKPYRFFMRINDFKKHIDYILSKDMLILTQQNATKIFCHGI